MQNYHAGIGSTVTLQCEGKSTTVDVYSHEGLNLLSNLWIKSAAEHRLMYEPTWLGRPVIQFSNDIVMIQELLWKIKPDVVVETGVAHGGSLVLSASLKHRIELIDGSSIALDTLDAVKRAVGDAKSVLIFLDSNHSEEHVLKELELYAPLITPGSYIVAHDGAQAWVWDIPSGKAEWRNNHPLNAIHKFLKSHSEFSIDPYWNRLGITSSPDGFLKRSES